MGAIFIEKHTKRTAPGKGANQLQGSECPGFIIHDDHEEHLIHSNAYATEAIMSVIIVLGSGALSIPSAGRLNGGRTVPTQNKSSNNRVWVR